VQDEVYLSVRSVAWVGWHIGNICVLKVCCRKKQIEFPASPEGIEITCKNDFLICVLNKAVEVLKLVLSVPIFERQVHNKDGHSSNICLDYKPFYTLFKIVALVILNTLPRKYGICLLLKHWNFMSK
jgi:hypothetical protein